MGKPIFLKNGTKFGKLTVLKLDYLQEYQNPTNKRKHLKKYYLCQCDCGNIVSVYQGRFISGHTTSCGCKTLKHGQWKSRLYNIWRGIKKRCYDKKNKSYKYYGAKSISMYENWINNFKSFYDWAVNNGYREDLTIDRIDNNGNYEPSNCRWVDNKTQANNKGNNRLITFNNKTHTITEWAKILNIPRHRIYYKLYKNLPISDIFQNFKGELC